MGARGRGPALRLRPDPRRGLPASPPGQGPASRRGAGARRRHLPGAARPRGARKRTGGTVLRGVSAAALLPAGHACVRRGRRPRGEAVRAEGSRACFAVGRRGGRVAAHAPAGFGSAACLWGGADRFSVAGGRGPRRHGLQRRARDAARHGLVAGALAGAGRTLRTMAGGCWSHHGGGVADQADDDRLSSFPGSRVRGLPARAALASGGPRAGHPGAHRDALVGLEPRTLRLVYGDR